MSAHDRALEAIRRGFALPPRLTPSEWAESHVVLPEGSAMPGPFRFAQTPYMREPFDCLGPDSPVRTVVVVGGAQIGKTQILLNALAFWIATDPKPIMAVWPTVDVARRLVRTRIDPLFKKIPDVSRRLVPERSREAGNATFLKTLVGGAELIVVGANAPAPLRSSPVNYVLLDEVSAYGPTLEGDVLDLVEERQNTYRLTAKTLAISTPLDEETCLITRAFNETEQSRYFLPCLQCDHHFPVTFAEIQWPKGRPEAAALVCPSCGRPHDDFEKVGQLARGRWQATAEGGDPTVRGFHIPGLLSPWLPYAKIAQRHQRAGKDPVRLRVFVNATLAEVWREDDGADLSESELLARREDWPEDSVPEDVVAITAGIDTQDDRLETTFIGWGAGEEAWILAHVVAWGDPSAPALWQDLDDLLKRTWRHPRAVPDLGVRAACLDTGGHHTLKAYDFVRDKAARRVWGIKGRSTPGHPLWPRSPSRRNKGRIPLFLIGADAAKDALFARLKMTEVGPGYMHFHAGLGPDYFEGLTSEKPVTKYNKGRPRREWTPISGRRNEPLDCAVYALAALHSLKSAKFDLDRDAAALRDTPMRNTPEGERYQAGGRQKPAPVVRSSWVSR